MNATRQRLAWLTLAVLALAAGPLFATASDTDEAAIDQYRVLTWQDLVPEGWEPPLVATAYDDEAAATVSPEAIVEDLDEQLAALPGYMKPVVFTGNEVTEFILVPFLPQHVTAHAHLDANQMVYVYAHEPVVVDNPNQPIWVVGSMTVDSVMTDEGPAAYRMVDAVTTEYEY